MEVPYNKICRTHRGKETEKYITSQHQIYLKVSSLFKHLTESESKKHTILIPIKFELKTMQGTYILRKVTKHKMFDL